MNYPNNIKLELLELCQEGYEENVDFLSKVEMLYQQGPLLEANKKIFIKQRSMEEVDIYHKRLERFTATSVLSQNINKVLGRFSGGQMQVEGLGDSQDWLDFRESVDDAGNDEKTFVLISFVTS